MRAATSTTTVVSQWERGERARSRQPRPAGVSLISVGTYRAATAADAPPHSYTVWKLALQRCGRVSATVGDREVEVHAGDVVVVPPLVEHAERASTAYANTYALALAPAGWPWPTHVPAGEIPDAPRIFETLLSESAGRGPDDALSELAAVALAELDIRLRRALRSDSCGAAGARRAQVVEQAEALMLSRLAGRPRVEELAAELGVAPSTLRSWFHAERGVSPQQRLRELRVAAAGDLVRRSDLTVESVASRTGFDSASHLRRTVRATTGQSLAALRLADRGSP